MIRVALFSTILGVEKTDQCPAYSGHLRAFALNSAEEAELREAAWVLEALIRGVWVESLGVYSRALNLVRGQRDFWEKVGFKIKV